jgi:hypothetical protein
MSQAIGNRVENVTRGVALGRIAFGEKIRYKEKSGTSWRQIVKSEKEVKREKLRILQEQKRNKSYQSLSNNTIYIITTNNTVFYKRNYIEEGRTDTIGCSQTWRPVQEMREQTTAMQNYY